MTYSARTRDRYRLAVSAVSGVTVVAALTCTGWLAGAAARDDAAAEAARADQAAQAAVAQAKYQADLLAWKQAAQASAHGAGQGTKAHVELRPRPQRTHVTLRYVRGTAPAAVGSGGLVTQTAGSTGSTGSTGTAAHQPAPAAPAPPPPPPPAPSSGS